jgi:DinB superfamily
MHATYAEALAAIRVALNDLDEVLAGLPDEALNWRPGPDANPIVVLARHSLTATKFLLGTAAGLAPDRQAYMTGERAEAFAAAGATVTDLRAEVAAAGAGLSGICEKGSEAALAAVAPWELSGAPRSGAYLVMHALGHLREHTGQAALIRDLWKAR